MTRHPIDAETLKALASMSADELGESEEDVKIRFVVPLLQALGHTRLRFEHKGMDVVLKTGLPRGCTVVVEVKRPDVSLDQHLAQLERYSFEERALLSVITNGRVLRVYAPFWNKAKSFAETILWEFQRSELAHSRHVEPLASVLSHDALVSKRARSALHEREATVEVIWEVAEDIRQHHREWHQRLEQRTREIDQQMAELAAEQRRCEKQLYQVGPQERDKVRRIFKLARVPLVPTGEFGDAATDGAAAARAATEHPQTRPKASDWTEEELWRKATPYQRAILAAFVAAGQRTLGIKEIAERTGLPPKVATAAMSYYRSKKQVTGREPLIVHHRASGKEFERRGNLHTLSARHWPLIQRLYRDKARPTKKRPKKRARK